MKSDDIAQLALTLGALYFGYRAFEGLSAPGRGAGTLLGDIWNGVTTPFEDIYGGTANIVDRINPFTEGPVFGWI